MIVIHLLNDSTSAVAVRVGLVDLPEEILEACVEALLPPLSECSPGFTIDTTPVSFPREIFALRLTSKLFHRIASPCAWRRLNIFVRYSRHFPSDYRAVFAKWNNLVEHSSILNHTRFLALEIHLDSPKIFSAALRPLIPTIGSLENLQVLRVKEGLFTGTTVDNHNVVHMIYTELLRQPRIHTLILESNVMPPPLHPSQSMENLRHLRVTIHAEPGWINALLQMTPRLEALSLCARKGVIISKNLPIPWATLREIEIRRIKNWQEIVNNFLHWKRLYPAVFSPLSEISIETRWKDSEILRKLLTVFSGRPVSRLVHCTNAPIVYDLPMLDCLVAAFPHLQKLRFRINPGVELLDIAKIIGRLGLLKLLQWDYISSDGVHRHTGDVVSTFGKYSPSLKYVLLQNFYKFKAFQIDRDSEGRYTGTSYIEDVRSIFGLEPGLEPLSLYTSAWRLDNYTYL